MNSQKYKLHRFIIEVNQNLNASLRINTVQFKQKISKSLQARCLVTVNENFAKKNQWII